MAEQVAASGLHRSVGLLGVVTLGAGTAIGVSIFSVLQPASIVAGSGLLVAMCIAALPMVLFAIAYSYLAMVYPVSGASYEWPRRFVHPLAGFSVAWLRILASSGAMIVLARVLVNYLTMAFNVPAVPTMAAAITLIFLLNYIGITVAARLQSVLMGLLLVVLAIFVCTGAPLATTARIGPLLGSGLGAILAGVPLMSTLFLGIESAVEIGEEVKNPRRTIPMGIAFAILLTTLVYMAVAVVALGLLGPQRLAATTAPLLEAAKAPLGTWALPLIVGAATISVLKTMNASAMVFSRMLFAMGRGGVFPQALTRVHPKFGTPHVAVIAAYCCSMTGLLLPSSLVFLLLAVNIPTMLKYLACSLSAARLASGAVEAPDREVPRRASIVWIGYAASACAVLIIAAGLGADWRPYLLVIGWWAIGLIYWFARGRRAGNLSPGFAQS